MAAFRRRLVDHLDAAEVARQQIEYLYIDSSADDCTAACKPFEKQSPDGQWRTRRASAALDPNQVVRLQPGGFKKVLDNPSDFEGSISDWLGDLNVWRRIWETSDNEIVAGGQMRRFGRYLFAANVSRVKDALDSVTRRFGRKRGAQANELTFHVLCGLAGGTGSGSFIDMICLIRRLSEDGMSVRILLYALLPEINLAQASWQANAEDTTYHANGYAALLELNALMLGRFQPFDVTGQRRPVSSSGVVNNVFILTNEPESGEIIQDIGGRLPEIVAEGLFQTIVLSGDSNPQAAGAVRQEAQVWKQALYTENLQPTPEKEFLTADGAGAENARAIRFATFGIKRVTAPVAEIKELLTSTFAIQAIMQMLHNNWSERQSQGFAKKPSAPSPLPLDPQTLSDLGLSGSKLRLDAPTFPDDGEDWRPALRAVTEALDEEVERLTQAAGDNRAAFAKQKPIEALKARAARLYQKDFRGELGVEEFYRDQTKRKASRAQAIAQAVDRMLYQSWLTGQMGLADAAATVEALSETLDELIETFKKEAKQFQKLREKAGREQSAKETALQQALTLRGRMLGGQKRGEEALNGFKAALVQSYTAETRRVALAYAQALASDLRARFTDQKRQIEELRANMEEIQQTLTSRRAELFDALEEAERDASAFKELLFDLAAVQETLRNFTSDRELQKRSTEAVRSAVTACAEDAAGFIDLKEAAGRGRLRQAMEREAENQVDIAHRDLLRDGAEKILTPHVVERLYQKYEGRDGDFTTFTRRVVAEAHRLCQFDQTEHERYEDAYVPRTAWAIFLPSAETLTDAQREFRALLEEKLSAALPPEEQNDVEIVESAGADHEFQLLSLRYLFPLRSVPLVEQLRRRYERRLARSDGEEARQKIHLEGDGRQLPLLHLTSEAERRQIAGRYWLIAEALGALQERENPRTGEPEAYFELQTDEHGLVDQIIVGRRIADRASAIGKRASYLLPRMIEQRLSEMTHRADREDVKARLRTLREEESARRGNDRNDADFKAFDATLRAALALVDEARR